MAYIKKYQHFKKEVNEEFKMKGKKVSLKGSDLKKLVKKAYDAFSVDNVKSMLKKAKGLGDKVIKVAKREGGETKEAISVLSKMVRGKKISEDEKSLLKGQSKDIARIVPLIAIQGIPAPVPITPLLVALGKKYGFSVLPDSQEEVISQIKREREALKESLLTESYRHDRVTHDKEEYESMEGEDDKYLIDEELELEEGDYVFGISINPEDIESELSINTPYKVESVTNKGVKLEFFIPICDPSKLAKIVKTTNKDIK